MFSPALIGQASLKVALVALLTALPIVEAATSSNLDAAIHSINIKLTNSANNQNTLERRLSSAQLKVEDAENKLAKAELDLNTAHKELEASKDSNLPTADTQQNLAAKKVELAENGLESRASRLTSAQEKMAAIELKLTENREASATLQASKNNLEQELLQVAKLEAEATRRATQAAQLAQAVTQTETPIIPQKPIQPRISTDVPENTLASIEGPISKPVAEPVVEISANERYAREQIEILNQKTQDLNKSSYQKFRDLYIKINRSEQVEMEFLGNYQYYAEISLPAGINKLQILAKAFAYTVQEQEDGNTFAVIYDTEKDDNPKFIVINKSMLD